MERRHSSEELAAAAAIVNMWPHTSSVAMVSYTATLYDIGSHI